MRKLIRQSIAILAPMSLMLISASASAGVFHSAAEKRERINRMEANAMERLFREADKAQALYDKSVGYAVFDVTKVSVGITGGGGTGVAVDRSTGKRVYMHMGTGGLNLGLGGQVMQVIFLFADTQTFKNFVDNGWDASASANAVAGRKGANAEAKFVNGVAVFQMTDAGLMLQADISGTKYWRSRKLNVPDELTVKE